VFVGFPGVPEVDLGAFHAGGLLAAPVGGEDLPVDDHIGQPVGLGAFQRLVQGRGLVGEALDLRSSMMPVVKIDAVERIMRTTTPRSVADFIPANRAAMRA
jgi:hypothetical protein